MRKNYKKTIIYSSIIGLTTLGLTSFFVPKLVANKQENSLTQLNNKTSEYIIKEKSSYVEIVNYINWAIVENRSLMTVAGLRTVITNYLNTMIRFIPDQLKPENNQFIEDNVIIKANSQNTQEIDINKVTITDNKITIPPKSILVRTNTEFFLNKDNEIVVNFDFDSVLSYWDNVWLPITAATFSVLLILIVSVLLLWIFRARKNKFYDEYEHLDGILSRKK